MTCAWMEILKLPNHSSSESLVYWAPHFYLVSIIGLQSDEPTVCPLVTIGSAKIQRNVFPIGREKRYLVII